MSEDLVKKGRRSGIAMMVNQMTRASSPSQEVPPASKQIYYPDSNRIGKFNVLYERLENGDEREMLGALFALCVILDVEDHESGRGKTYIAASPLFEPLEEGQEVPEYRIEATQRQPFAQPDHEARRVQSSNGFAFVAIRKNIIRVPAIQIGTKLHSTN